MDNLTLHFGDNRDILPTLPEDSVDLIVTSPPYWDVVNYTWGMNDTDIGRKQSLESYIEDLKSCLTLCKPLLKRDAYFCIVIRDVTKNRHCYPLHIPTIEIMNRLGFTLEDIKYILLLAHCHYDFILIFRHGKAKGNGIMKDKYDEPFWDLRKFPNPSNHPASFKPIIPRILIEKFSNEGDTVLDPFLGSGTTAMEALRLNRRAVGIEVNISFKSIIERNLTKLKNHRNLDDFV
jgi:DNA modification methylase